MNHHIRVMALDCFSARIVVEVVAPLLGVVSAALAVFAGVHDT